MKPDGDIDTDTPVSTIEIPLSSDAEFFHILTSELSALDIVQTRAAKIIQNEIIVLGDSVTAVAAPRSLALKQSDLYPWREIFRMYLDMGIFISNLEIERHKERDADEAQVRLEKFSNEVSRLGLRKQFKRRESGVLYSRFIAVNMEVLRVMRFQDINKLAMRKILKSSYSPSDCCHSFSWTNLVQQNSINAPLSAPAIYSRRS